MPSTASAGWQPHMEQSDKTNSIVPRLRGRKREFTFLNSAFGQSALIVDLDYLVLRGVLFLIYELLNIDDLEARSIRDEENMFIDLEVLLIAKAIKFFWQLVAFLTQRRQIVHLIMNLTLKIEETE
jgi:hypothetical protein